MIITNRGRPAYRLLPIIPVPLRSALDDTTALAMQSKPSQNLVNGSFVANWRSQNERF